MTTLSPAASGGPGIPLVRFLYTQNPFYLVGTALVLVGLQQSVGADFRVATSGLLPALLAGYTLLLAGIAVLVIRGGQVWDDARTILLVLVLLFFMLSASLDVQLVRSPAVGTLLSVAALAFVLAVSEGLLRALRIQLAPRYRGPFYLILTLLFLFPAVPAWLTELGYDSVRPLSLFAFPALAALALLTLLPAAGARRRHEPTSGTPWRWPYYPWSLFVFLTVGLGLRSWWLTISFETAPGPSYFQPYFLLPLCLAWSALLIEIGRARASRGAIAAGLLLPLAGLACAFPGFAEDEKEAAFLHMLVSTIGSPAQIAVAGSLLFYAWAWLRRVRAAEGFLILLGLGAAFVGPDTFTLDSLSRPQPLPPACVALALLTLAIRQRSSWRAIASGAIVLGGLRFAGLGMLDEHALRFWQWHAPILGLMTLSTLFQDDLARMLRELSWRSAPVLAGVAALVYPWVLPGVTPAVLAGYLVMILLVSISLWQRQKEVGPLTATLATGAANVLSALGLLYQLLQYSLLAGGLPFLAGGLLVVVVAVTISLLKMGLWQQARSWLERLNLRLGGVPAA